MKIRPIAAVLCFATFALADAGKTVNADVDKVTADGKVRVELHGGSLAGVYPGDKGFFVKDGVKVDGSDFPIDRVDESLAWASTSYKTEAELPSKKLRVTTSRTCARGGARPETAESDDTRNGRKPAAGFAFAKVIAAEKVHNTKIRVTIDKGSDDGVLPASSGYALGAGEGRPFAQYVGVEWVEAKKASLTVDAGNADEMLAKVKRIAYEKLACK